MKTRVVVLDRNDLKREQFGEAARLLKKGELVAFPTETVYGLGGNALDPKASGKIYAAKGRPSDNPLIVHIADVNALPQLAEDIPECAYRLAERFWPGPMTMILKKRDIVPKETTGGLDTVAIRFPSDPIARMMIEESGLFIAAPSANASGRPSPTNAGHVFEDLNGRIPMILDGGPVQIGLESTIIDLTGEKPLILRPGYITAEQLREILPNAEYDPAILAEKPSEALHPKAPGMKYRHYAPKGQLTIYEGTLKNVTKAVRTAAEEKKAEGFKVAILASEETKDCYEGFPVCSLGSRDDEDAVAAHLFDTLREFDHMGADYIFGECFRSEGVGSAIMNRLLKAAGYHIVRV